MEIKAHAGLEVSGPGLCRGKGRVIVQTPPTRSLVFSPIGVFTSFFMSLFSCLTVPLSFFIAQVYLRGVHPELVESGHRVSPLEVFSKQIKARPPFFQQTIPGFFRKVRKSINRFSSQAFSYGKKPIYS